MLNVLLVFLGGGLGATGRYVTSALALRHFGPGFPFGTLIVNVAGSMAMGLLIAWLVQRDVTGAGSSSHLRLFLATGLLGGFTTFSAFSLDFANLWQRGEFTTALAYAAASVALSLAAVFVGLALGRAVLG